MWFIICETGRGEGALIPTNQTSLFPVANSLMFYVIQLLLENAYSNILWGLNNHTLNCFSYEVKMTLRTAIHHVSILYFSAVMHETKDSHFACIFCCRK